MSYKEEKVKELIRHLAAEYLEKESNRTSLVTVTDVVVYNKGKNADILLTVFPDNKEKEAIEFIQRQKSDFQEYVREKSKLGQVPFFDFKIDFGEKNRQRVDELLNNK